MAYTGLPKLIFWLVLAAGLMAPGDIPGQSADAAGKPLTLSGYERAVHVARLSLDRLAGAPVEAEVSRIRQDLQNLDRVRLPDGGTLQTNTPQLAGELTPGDPGSVRRVRGQLDALDDALRSAPRSRPDPQVLRELDSVLQDPRFRQNQSLWSIVRDWLQSLALRLLTMVIGSGSFNPVIAWGFAALFLALVAVVVFLAGRGALGRMVVDVRPASTAERPIQSAATLDRAEQEAAAGDYRLALRYLFLAIMLALQERGMLELRPGLTNHEYLAALRTAVESGRDNALQDFPSLQRLVEEFDRIWYGHRPFGAADFARCQALAQQVLAALPSRRAA